MEKQVVRHRVERTKNKHSRAVYKNGTIVIRLARGLSEEEEKEHIDDLLFRMSKNVEEEEAKTIIDPFQRLLDYGENATVNLANGQKFIFTLRPGKKTRVHKNARGWTIWLAPKMRRKGLHLLLWKTLAKSQQKNLEEIVHTINDETYGVHIEKIRFCIASSQWGSCSPSGVIMLNSALLFVHPEVLRYVIVHELAHRKRADHSPQYWAWVEWAMPKYKKWRNELHEYRLPIL